MVAKKKKEVSQEPTQETTVQASDIQQDAQGQVSDEGLKTSGDATTQSSDEIVDRYVHLLTSGGQVSQTQKEEEPETKEEESEETTAIQEEEASEQTDQQASEQTEEEQEGSHSPVAVLKVYGQEIPVHSKEELIRYAQMGVDYAYKMHQLKRWANEIRFIQNHPELREIIRKGLEGEDISKYLRTKPASEKPEPTLTTGDSEATESGEEDVIKKTVEEVVHQKVAPYLYTINTTMFIQSLRQSDPKYADVILATMASWKDNPPPDLPPKLLEAIDTDPNTFLAVYRAIRNRLVALENEAKKVTAQQKVSKFKGSNKPPVVEKGAGSAQDLGERMLEEAKSIWDLDDETFQKLKARVKQGF